jgi:hypothetical protein
MSAGAVLLLVLVSGCGEEPPGSAAVDPAAIQGTLLDAPLAPPAPVPAPAGSVETPAPPPPSSPAAESDPLVITWDLLASYQVEAAGSDQHELHPPDAIKALHDRRVHITGFMIPLDLNQDRITSFMLSRYPPQCCFGQLPFLNEWIAVDANDIGGVPFAHFSYVTVSGRFTLKDVSQQKDELTNLYQLVAETVREEM